jgi:hypothetical protein
MTTRGIAAAAIACVIGAWAPSLRAGEDIKLTGCLVKAEGNDGYLLTNTPDDPGWQHASDARVTPSAVGTTGGFATIFYWLNGDGDLKNHVGHRVEVEGDLKGDLRDGEIKVDRKDDWTELTIKSDGHDMKARVPNTSVFPASKDNKDEKGNILVRRVDVDHVKMLGASCTP